MSSRGDTQNIVEKSLASLTIASIFFRDRKFGEVREDSPEFKETYAVYDRCYDIANKAALLAQQKTGDDGCYVPAAILILTHLKEIEKILRSNELIADIAKELGV